ncbi:MAG: ribose 5-phosphate isomerase B [Candidatus Diapherotrites archaeon]
MKIHLGSDHAGYKTKEYLKKKLEKTKNIIIDHGTFEQNQSDYPDYAKKVAEEVTKDKKSIGVLICGTGIGMSITANKIKGIRAANPFNEYTAKLAREHNNANIICLGGRTYSKRRAEKILEAFLKAKPSKEKRHKKRIKKIEKIEEQQ